RRHRMNNAPGGGVIEAAGGHGQGGRWPQPGTFLSISRPILPSAISRSAVTPGLFLLSILGAWPWLSMRARYVAASTSWKRFGMCCRQSSTVMRAMNQDSLGKLEDAEGLEGIRQRAA